ncbi:MAG: hypothetical protein QME47_07790 [Candidatus Thermoplasmatota archaeon]|nr:hypothetical protein [Candidatus Thermoplasmatota archaeon]
MAIIYLDIEIYSLKVPSIEDKVIALGVGVNSKEKKYWEEWKRGEKEMIRNFYVFLKKSHDTGQTVGL